MTGNRPGMLEERLAIETYRRMTPAAEQKVYYSVEYSVDGGGRELIAPDTLALRRDYSYDETAVLAKQREQSLLREALARDLAGMVVRRLAAL